MKKSWQSIIGGKPPSISAQIADATQGDAAGSEALDNAGAENLSGAGATRREMTMLDAIRDHARRAHEHMSRICDDMATLKVVIWQGPRKQRIATFTFDVSAVAANSAYAQAYHLPDRENVGAIYLENAASNQNTVTAYPGSAPGGVPIVSVVGGTWKRIPLQDGVSSVCLKVPVAVGAGNVRLILHSGVWSPAQGALL